MKLEWINEAIADRRRLVKRLLCLAAVSVLALLILAPDARAQSGNLESQGITLPCPFQLDRFPEGTICGEGGAYIDPETQQAAQPLPPENNESQGITLPCPSQLDRFPPGTVCGEGGAYINPATGEAAQPLDEGDAGGGFNPVEDPGDNVDPNTGEVVGDDTPDCARPEDVLESGLCRTDEAAPPGTSPGGGEDGEITCEDFEDQGQAQQALGRGLRGDPAYDPEVLDDDGDGVACEELPTATDPDAPPAPGTGSGEGGTVTCEDLTDQGQAQEILNRALRGDPEYDADVLDPDGDGVACEELPTATDRSTGGEDTSGESTGGEGTGGEGTGGGGAGDSGGGNGSAGSNEGSGASQGGVSGAVSDGLGSVIGGRLPNTGGGWAVLLLVGAALIGAGLLLVRRFSSSA